jgi:hypothetical protein
MIPAVFPKRNGEPVKVENESCHRPADVQEAAQQIRQEFQWLAHKSSAL